MPFMTKLSFFWLFVWHHARKMDAFYVKGVVNFDFLFDTMTRNVCFCVVFNVTPLFWLGQSAPEMEAFHNRCSQCVILSLLKQNVPEMDDPLS